MSKSTIRDLLPTWTRHIQPYPSGKPIEEVERELGHSARKLASNENPLGPSPRALEAIQQSLFRAHLYPDSAGYDLRLKLARFHGIGMDQVILGSGSTDLIYLFARTFLSPEDEAIVSESSFHVYRLAVEGTGAACRAVPLRNMAVDLAAILHAITPRTKAIFLGNPNNPTGTLFSAAEFAGFLAALPFPLLVVLDEAYYHYVQRQGYSHPLDDFETSRNVLVLRTFSKVYGLAGLRIGYGIGHAEMIEALARMRPPFNTSRPAQAAAIAALEDAEHVARSIDSNAREMRYITEELSLLGVHFTPSAANFILIDTARDCEHDFLRLLDEGVIVRPMKLYGFPTSLRVTVGTHEDNEIFLEALRSVMAASVRAGR